MRWGILWLIAAGCGFQRGSAVGNPAPSDAPGGDSFVGDTGPDSALPCFGQGFLRVCETAAPPSKYEVTTPGGFDTGSMCDSIAVANESNVCIKIADQIKISKNLRVSGPKPLVLVATTTLEVNALLDVSSRTTTGVDGPGANATACGNNGTPSGGQGGPGGSFGGQGGPGSNGAVGAAGAQAKPSTLRGGCPGTTGGGNTGGAGGSGGGAVYLIAGTSITVMAAGTIDASGGGGHGAPPTNTGGGGGGSGGLVVLDATMVANMGSIYANGGGGGEGADTATGHNGGDPASAAVAALGGSMGTLTAGNGGIGSAGAVLAGGAGLISGTAAGDGGGGGAAGYVLLFGAGAITGPGPISPPHQ